jgi:hypothetical protein
MRPLVQTPVLPRKGERNPEIIFLVFLPHSSHGERDTFASVNGAGGQSNFPGKGQKITILASADHVIMSQPIIDPSIRVA